MFDILREAVETVLGKDRMYTRDVIAEVDKHDHLQRPSNFFQTEKNGTEHSGQETSAYCVHGWFDSNEMKQKCKSCSSLQNCLDKSSTEFNPCVETLCEQLTSVDMSGGIGLRPVNPLASESMYTLNQIYVQDVDGDTLLHSAIITLNSDIAKLFVDVTPSNEFLNIKNNLGQTPLHLAALTNQVSVLRRLMVGGADILTRDKNGGNTPLHIACRKGYTQMVRALIDPVRYIETKGNRYDIPYQRIPQDLSIVNYDGMTCMHIAALNGHTDIVKLLIDKHGDPNCGERKTGRNVLHIACVEGNIELVKMLLQYRSCDINARAYNGHTPFDLARDRGHTRILYELAVAGAEYLNEIDMDEY